MIYTFTKKIDCSKISYAECQQNIIKKLSGLNLKLEAEKDTDTVHGSVTMLHEPRPQHIIKIELYDKDEEPTAEHQSTLKKPSRFPSREEIEKLI